MSADVHMEIAGVRMDVPTGQPVVVLRELDGPRRLPILSLIHISEPTRPAA